MRQFLISCLVVLAVCMVGKGVAYGQSDEEPYGLIEDLSGNVLISDTDVFEILSRTSLMLTTDQKSRLESAKALALALIAQRDSLAALQNDGTFVEALATRDFVLDAIMYLSPTSWTIWINGEAFKPDRVPEDIRIVAVTPGSAEIVWFADPANPADVRQFELLPGQMYMADTGEIIEASQRQATPDDIPADQDANTPQDDDGALDAGDGAAPGDLDLSAGQAEQLRALQDALGMLPEGVLPAEQAAELEALQESLNAGDGGGLTDEQVRQLEALQSLIGGGG